MTAREQAQSCVTGEVVVAGAGLVGLSLACALSRRHIPVTLVDPRAPLPADTEIAENARVSALNRASVQFLDTLGVWQGVAARAVPYANMEVWDGPGTARIRFDARELQCQSLGQILGNDCLLQALEACAQERGVRCLWGRRIRRLESRVGEQCLELDDGEQLRGELLIIADGATSPTRSLAGFAHYRRDYGHQALVSLLDLEGRATATAWQCFTDSGPLALLPMAGGASGCHRAALVWSVPPPEARRLLALDEQTLAQRLTRETEAVAGAVLGCRPLATFPLRAGHAPSYVQPGRVLVGDAAHSIHPLAGQGVNLGLADAAVLVEELDAGRKRGARLGDSRALRQYQRRRLGPNLEMLAAMEALRRLYGEAPPLIQGLRNWGLRRVASSSRARRWFCLRALGIQASSTASSHRALELNSPG